MFWIPVLCSLIVVQLLTHLKYIAQYDLCDSGVYSREIINMLFICQVSWLVENFIIWIFLDTIDVIYVRLCMMVSSH